MAERSVFTLIHAIKVRGDTNGLSGYLFSCYGWMQHPSSPSKYPSFVDLLQQQREATSGGRREPENELAQASSGGRRERGAGEQACPGFGISLAPPLKLPLVQILQLSLIMFAT